MCNQSERNYIEVSGERYALLSARDAMLLLADRMSADGTVVRPPEVYAADSLSVDTTYLRLLIGIHPTKPFQFLCERPDGNYANYLYCALATAKIQAEPKHETHNPENVDEGSLPKGWRFLYKFEVLAKRKASYFIRIWDWSNYKFYEEDPASGGYDKYTYCTSLSVDDLAELDRLMEAHEEEKADTVKVKVEHKPVPSPNFKRWSGDIYTSFDLYDHNVRKSLWGRTINVHQKDGVFVETQMIHRMKFMYMDESKGTVKGNGYWVVNGLTDDELLNHCTWSTDDSPFGERVK